MLTTGAWRQLAERGSGRDGVDVERVNMLKRERRIREIVFELTHKPVLVKTRERQFTNDMTAALMLALGEAK